MKGYKELNLNPKVINKSQISLVIKISGLVILIIVIFSVGVVIHLNNTINEEKKQIQLKEAYINKNKDKFEEWNKISREISTIQSGIEKIDKVRGNVFKISDVIEKFNGYLPQEVSITNLNVNEGVIQVNCESMNYKSAVELLANLQMSQEFSTVSISTITVKEDGKCNFSIAINKGDE